MKNIFIFLPLISLVFFFSACKKTNTDSPSGLNCRMLELTGPLYESHCFYDDHHKIVKMRFIDSPADTSWENYYYENGHVVYMIRLFQGTSGDTIYYTYNSGKYVEVNEYGFKLKFIYNDSGQLIKVERYEGSKVTDYSDYEYNQGGNCIRCIDYTWSGSEFAQEQITDLEFGNQKNPYSSIGLPPLNSTGWPTAMYLSPNNITKYRIQYTSQLMKLVLVYHYSSYNENGYPLAYSITDSLNHMISNENIQYICP
jgi:hypothetical protein